MNPTSTDGINMAKDGEMLLIIAILPNIFKIKLNPKAIKAPNQSLSKFLFLSNKNKESATDNNIIEMADKGSSNFFQNS